ncbi:hypothetical protein BH09PLA1_BH09PLA1_25470 [soil metagenome]
MDKTRTSVRRLLGIALLCAALLQLGFRGMQRVRHEMPLWDFVNPYAAARAWIHGMDPYSHNDVIVAWQQTGFLNDREWTHWASVYPPTSLALIAPLAALPPRMAMAIWFGILMLLLVLQFRALVDLVGWRWSDPRAPLLVAATLFAAPSQFAILSGQLSLAAIALCIIAFWCDAKRTRPTLAGVLIAIACALKPQVAGVFVVFYLWRRRWNVVRPAIAVAALIGIGAIGTMQLTHPNWLRSWTDQIYATTTTGRVNDYSWSGHFRDHIIDLKMLLVSWIHDPMMLRATVVLSTIALLGWFVRAFPRGQQQSPQNLLLALATLCAISLLPIYHRVYDASLLVLALAWAMHAMDDPLPHRRRLAIVMLIAMSPLLIPFDVAHVLGHRAPRLVEMTQTAWWQTWIAPHFAWGLLFTATTLLATLSRETIAQPKRTPARVVIAGTEPPRLEPPSGEPPRIQPDEDDDDVILAH